MGCQGHMMMGGYMARYSEVRGLSQWKAKGLKPSHHNSLLLTTAQSILCTTNASCHIPACSLLAPSICNPTQSILGPHTLPASPAPPPLCHLPVIA